MDQRELRSKVHTPVGSVDGPYGDVQLSLQYGGFWLRFWASIVDSIVLAIPLIGLVMAAPDPSGPAISETWVGVFVVAYFFVPWLYFAAFESSLKQATIGKQFLGLRVTDVYGARISFGRAIGRNLGKNISYMIFGIGYLMVPFTPRKQALHDMMAGCLVLRDPGSAEDPDYV